MEKQRAYEELWSYITSDMLDRLNDRCKSLGLTDVETVGMLLALAARLVAMLSSLQGKPPDFVFESLATAAALAIEEEYRVPCRASVMVVDAEKPN